jgi:hypothetical protein
LEEVDECRVKVIVYFDLGSFTVKKYTTPASKRFDIDAALRHKGKQLVKLLPLAASPTYEAVGVHAVILACR